MRVSTLELSETQMKNFKNTHKVSLPAKYGCRAGCIHMDKTTAMMPTMISAKASEAMYMFEMVLSCGVVARTTRVKLLTTKMRIHKETNKEIARYGADISFSTQNAVSVWLVAMVVRIT